MPAVVELSNDQLRALPPTLFQPAPRRLLEDGRLFQPQDDCDVGSFDEEEIGPGDRNLVDDRVCEKAGEQVASQAELVLELLDQVVIAGLDR